MDSDRDVQDCEPSAKRLKLDPGDTVSGEVITGEPFSNVSKSEIAPIADIRAEETKHDCHFLFEPNSQLGSRLSTELAPGSLIATSSQDATDTDQLDALQDGLEDDDDNSSTVSQFSELSGLSNLSGQAWKPMVGSMVWIRQQMQKGLTPREVLNNIGAEIEHIPTFLDDMTLWRLIFSLLTDPPRRSKLRHVNTLDDVVRLLKGSQRIIILTGAGVSVSCGIPDFRSKDGIYSRLAAEFPNLPDPQAMFDINFFSQDPRPFFKFAKDIYPGKFKPSPCHRFIKLLEKQGKLLRNYTQNIDTLEKEAGIERVIECHGSFATATCTKCEHKVGADKIREVVLSQKIPICEMCHGEKDVSVSADDPGNQDYKDLVLSGIMKPDIVFFGEGLSDTFHEAMAADKSECDLLLVIGSSLKVRPVAMIPEAVPPHVPQILINREPLPHCFFDVELLGDCDVIINHLCRIMGQNWQECVWSDETLTECHELLPREPAPVFDVNKWRDANESVTKASYSEEIEAAEYSYCEACSARSSNTSSDVTCACKIGGKSSKERQISVDSARDSGIGDNSNFTDLETDTKESSSNFTIETPTIQDSSTGSGSGNGVQFEYKSQDMRGYWQPKIKKSLADRLPPNTFHLLPPNRYVFPGAEIYYDPDEKSSSCPDSDSDDTLSEC